MALISEYLAADSSPDASADALAIINIGNTLGGKTIILGITGPFTAYLEFSQGDTALSLYEMKNKIIYRKGCQT